MNKVGELDIELIISIIYPNHNKYYLDTAALQYFLHKYPIRSRRKSISLTTLFIKGPDKYASKQQISLHIIRLQYTHQPTLAHMLLENNYSLRINPAPRILEGLTLFVNGLRSYIMLICSDIDDSTLRLYDSTNSNLIWQKKYPDEILAYGALDRSTFLFLHVKSHKIYTLNVDTLEEKAHDFHYEFDEFALPSKVAFFPESKIFCIYEVGTYDKTACRFTFFNHEFKQVWECKAETLYNATIYPINEKSKMVYFYSRVEPELKFTVVDCKEKKAKSFSVPKPGTAEMALKEVHQLNPGNYYLAVDTAETRYKHIVYNETDSTSRDFKVQMPDKIYDSMISGDFMYIFCYNLSEEGQNLRGPLVVINRKKEQKFDETKCLIAHAIDYNMSTEGDNSVLEIHNIYHNPEEVKVKTLRPVNQKELYIHLLKNKGFGLKNDEIEVAMTALDFD